MKIALLAAFVFAVTAPSFADITSDTLRIMQDCKAERKKFCRKSKPEGGPLACLMKHKAESSEGCKAALDAIKGGELPSAATPMPDTPGGRCLAEYQKVCKGVKSKELKNCLHERKNELSEECRHVVEMSEKYKKPATP